MQTEAAVVSAAPPRPGSGRIFALIFGVILLIGAGYAGLHLVQDLSAVRSHSIAPFLLLGTRCGLRKRAVDHAMNIGGTHGWLAGSRLRTWTCCSIAC